MEYAELNLYSKQGGEAFTVNNITKDKKTKLVDENDKKILKIYKKKIIEQRQEIESLKRKLEKYEK
jgi:hypothetical protein